jgi:hypothetical protein
LEFRVRREFDLDLRDFKDRLRGIDEKSYL